MKNAKCKSKAGGGAMKIGIYLTIIIYSLLTTHNSQAQLVNTTHSPFARLQSIGLSDVHWTTGFWAERFAVCRNVMLPQLWTTYTSDTMCYAFQNFRIAAGLDTGKFRGPSF